MNADQAFWNGNADRIKRCAYMREMSLGELWSQEPDHDDAVMR
jgi:hypothetical protein